MSNRASVRSLLSAVAAVAASACSTGGSMRIDVEVYKGPLSKTVEVQCAELIAQVSATEGQLYDIRTYVADFKPKYIETAGGVTEVDQTDADNGGDVASAVAGGAEKVTHALTGTSPVGRNRCGRDCAMRDALLTDIDWAIANVQAIMQTEQDKDDDAGSRKINHESEKASSCSKLYTESGAEALLAKIATFGADLRQRAEAQVAAQTAIPSRNKGLRLLSNRFSVFAAEAGNQIVSRTDALLLQRRMIRETYANLGNTAGNSDKKIGLITPAQRLATSIYLRDSNVTAYQNLYDWNRNVNISRSRPGDLSELDRVRLAEELMRDTYWSKINTVHASGQGDTSMAFIKDDIGNWNLKSFSADPERLLNAYSDLTRSVIGEAAQMLTSGGTLNAAEAGQKITAANKLLNFAGKASVGGTTEEPTIGPDRLSDMRGRIHERLGQIKADLAEARKPKAADVLTAQGRVTALSDTRATLETEKDCLQDQILAVKDAPESDDPVCRKVIQPPPGPGDGAMTLEEKQDKWRQRLEAKNNALAANAEQSQAAVAGLNAAKAELAKVDKAGIERARLVLRDHAAVVSALQEVLAPESLQAETESAAD